MGLGKNDLNTAGQSRIVHPLVETITKGQALQAAGQSHIVHVHFVMNFTNSSACENHSSFFWASIFQLFQPFESANLRKSSSHLNHLVFLGRFILRWAKISTSILHHSLSRHSVARLAKRIPFMRATWPAHKNLFRI